MKPLLQINGDELIINPHAGQQAAIRAMKQARFVFIIAGTQSGKTSFLPVGAKIMIEQHGPGDYLAVTASYDLYKLKFLPEMLTFFTQYLRGEGWQWIAADRVLYRPRDKTRIILRSASAEGGLESATVKGALLDECGQDDFKLESWEAVQRRLSLSQGPVLAGTTPYNLGWLKTQVFDRWRAGDRDYRVVQFKSTMNPAFPVAEYERARRTLPDWKFRMFYDGEFTRPAGMIYDIFDTEKHVIQPFAIPPHWPRWGGLDFGGVHTAAVCYAENPVDGTLYLTDEYLAGGRTAAQHAAELKPWNCRLFVGGSKSEEQWRDEFSAAGLPIAAPEITEVEVGINRVYGCHKQNMIYVFNTCRRYLDQKGTYSRELDDLGQPIDKIKNKDTYHFMDAERYIIGYIRGERVTWDDLEGLGKLGDFASPWR